MSSYDNVVGGKLKLKGKALDVQSGVTKKKRKKEKTKQQLLDTNQETGNALGDNENASQEPGKGENRGDENSQAPVVEDHRTAAEKRYHEQKLKLDVNRLKKVASKSHRERIGDFNQYLANLSEHYDIPKVGPG